MAYIHPSEWSFSTWPEVYSLPLAGPGGRIHQSPQGTFSRVIKAEGRNLLEDSGSRAPKNRYPSQIIRRLQGETQKYLWREPKGRLGADALLISPSKRLF